MNATEVGREHLKIVSDEHKVLHVLGCRWSHDRYWGPNPSPPSPLQVILAEMPGVHLMHEDSQPDQLVCVCGERVYGIISAFYIEWQRRVCWLRGNFHHAVYTIFKYRPSLHPPWARIHITSAILHVLVTAISVFKYQTLKLFWIGEKGSYVNNFSGETR